MGKKKPFIDKNTASTFHIVRRSQRDVGGYFDDKGVPLDMPQEFILMPSPETQQQLQSKSAASINSPNHDTFKKASSSWDKAKVQLKQAGITDDYDYNQHLLPITGSGIFISSESGTIMTPALPNNTMSNINIEQSSIQEVDRQFESIALNASCIDDDMAHALFDDYEDGEFEELNDDFCILASQEPETDNYSTLQNSALAFDFDAHIAKLIEKAKRDEGNNGLVVVAPHNHTWWQQNEHEFRGIKARNRRQDVFLDNLMEEFDIHSVHEEEEEEDSRFSSNIGAKRFNHEEEKASCEKFERTLAEYDDSSDDEVELLDAKMDSLGGFLQMEEEEDARFEALLDEYLLEKKDEIFIEGTKKHLSTQEKMGGSSFKVLSGRRMVKQEEMDLIEEPTATNLGDILAEADYVLSKPVMDLPPEEILIDGTSYFAEKVQSRWDCESILSTYSNLDNNPVIIGRKKKHDKRGGRESTQIHLSRKTGLPIIQNSIHSQVIQEDGSTSTSIHLNLGVTRNKHETKDEKRMRKATVKELKQMSRMQKKMVKEAFQAEIEKRCQNTDDIGGVSVFRY